MLGSLSNYIAVKGGVSCFYGAMRLEIRSVIIAIHYGS